MQFFFYIFLVLRAFICRRSLRRAPLDPTFVCFVIQLQRNFTSVNSLSSICHMSRWLGRTVQSGTFPSREGGPAVGVDRGSQRTGPRQGGRPAAEVSWLTRLATQTGSPPKKMFTFRSPQVHRDGSRVGGLCHDITAQCC